MISREGDIAGLAILGIAYLFYVMKSDEVEQEISDPENSDPYGYSPKGTDIPLPDKWEMVYEVPNYHNVVWVYSTSVGLLYANGLDERHYEDYILIGNREHTGFVHDSSEYGQLNTPFGKAKAYQNVGVAVDELNRKAASPTGPEGLPPVTPPPVKDWFGGNNTAGPQF